MFQYMWYDRNEYAKLYGKHIDLDAVPNIDSLIEYVRLDDWQEHCLECSAPDCFATCKNFQKRVDRRCANTKFGIYRYKKGNVLARELTFRRWGKLETRIVRATTSPKKARRLDSVNYYVSLFLRSISFCLSFALKRYPLCNRYFGLTHHIWSKWYHPQNRETDTFIFRCYYHGSESAKLFFDVLSGELLFREGLQLKTGLNEIFLKLPNHVLDVAELARIYPEDNLELHLSIYQMGFAKMKQKPQNEFKHAAKVKCVVWDLDNTLWDGVLIETDPEKLQLRPGIRELLSELDERGILNTIASKNERADAEAVLKRLGINQLFLYPAINWNPKSGEILTIAKKLNLDPNSFAFIDDSPFERGEVSENVPGIRVYGETITETLLRLPEFDVPITADSKKRRLMYLDEMVRDEFSRSFEKDNLAFLRNCKIRLEFFEPKTDEELLRSYELIQRTNQLNLSGKKYGEAAFQQFFTDGRNRIVSASCSDRFGSYGQILFFIYQQEELTITVHEFAMSCRVASKCVESAVLQWLRLRFESAEDGTILFVGNVTNRNSLLVKNMVKAGMRDTHRSDSEIRLELAPGAKISDVDVVGFEVRRQIEK